jgi:hypothetical protein
LALLFKDNSSGVVRLHVPLAGAGLGIDKNIGINVKINNYCYEETDIKRSRNPECQPEGFSEAKVGRAGWFEIANCDLKEIARVRTSEKVAT